MTVTTNKNNPDGTMKHAGAQVHQDVYNAFADKCKEQMQSKTAVIRALITFYAEHGELPKA